VHKLSVLRSAMASITNHKKSIAIIIILLITVFFMAKMVMGLVHSVYVVKTPATVQVKLPHEQTFSEYPIFSKDIKQKIRFSEDLWHYTYKLKIPAEHSALLISQFMDGGTIFVNGIKISQLPTSTTEYKYLWYRPHLVYLPEQLRTPGRDTEVVINSSSYSKYLYIMPAYAGGIRDIQDLNDVFSFVSRTLSMASSLVAVVAGILLLMTWRINKQDQLFFYAGVSAIAWSGLYFWLNTAIIPAEVVKLSRLVMYTLIGTSLYNLMQYLILLSQSQASLSYKKLLLLVTVSGPIIYCASLGSAQQIIDKYWIGLMFASCLPAMLMFVRHLKSTSQGFNQIVGLILIIAMTTAYKDYTLIGYEQSVALTREMTFGDFLKAPLFSSHLVMSVAFIFSAGRLIERYKASLQTIQQHNVKLITELQKNELKLNISHLENIQKKEREITELTRAAIHRDLHDGIGSRLVATTYALRSGKLTRDKLEESLLNCLKDIKAIMQTEIDQETRSIQNLLFEYLSEMEDILSGTEVKLTYSIPEDRDFTLLGNRSVEILRMIQEILSNALKHSSAKHVNIHMELTDSLVSVKIKENEFDSKLAPLTATSQVASSNTGLKSLEARAKNIGAIFLQKSTETARISMIALKLFVDRQLYLPDHLPPGKDERRVFLTSQISDLTDN